MPSTSDTGLTAAELIRLELDGKNVALGRYDSILWKIRSGYVVVLYGSLSLLFGKVAEKGIEIAALDIKTLLLMSGFSLLAYSMDLTFRIRQLRVVDAKNLLSDQAVKLVSGESIDATVLRELLHIAGESRGRLTIGAAMRAALLILLFYAATPTMIAIMHLTR